MIQLSSVTKIFKNKTAVDNISFKAKEGEIIGFLGPNGAGKTTTMRLILGYLTPSEGNVLIDNLSPFDDRIKILSRLRTDEHQTTQDGRFRIESEEDKVSF